MIPFWIVDRGAMEEVTTTDDNVLMIKQYCDWMCMKFVPRIVATNVHVSRYRLTSTRYVDTYPVTGNSDVPMTSPRFSTG